MGLHKRTILLPVETLNREFDGKLLLALHAAERGWRVIIGSQEDMHRHILSFPRAIYLSKGVRSVNRAMFRIMAACGHGIVGLEEESLVRLNDDLFLMQMDPEVLRLTQMVFAWGQDDAQLFHRASELAETPILQTGNPRVDVMRRELRPYFKDKIDELRQRFGRFVLVNSNFAIVNHFIPGRERVKVADWVSPRQAHAMKGDIITHKRALFTAFHALVPELAQAIAPKQLVIRPHPSENHEVWRETARSLDNVSVVHEGSVVPWLAAADVLVHNSCTSAVEAAVMETPALSYRPVSDERFDNPLPNGLSTEFTGAADLCGEAGRLLNESERVRGCQAPARQDLLARHVAALDGPLACERLMDEIENRENTLGRDVGVLSHLRGAAKHVTRNLARTVRDNRAKRSSDTAYYGHKFPVIDIDEVRLRTARFQRTLERFGDVAIRQVRTNIFSVEAS